MYEEIVRVIGSYIFNHKEIDKAYYYKLYDIFADYLRLDDTLKGIYVDDIMIDPKNSGVYAPINKIIVLNYYPSEAYKLLLNEADKYNEMSSIYLNSLLIIDTMIHEINHAILFDEIEKGENSLIHELVRKSSHVLNRKDFNSIFDYFANDKLSKNVYNNNHDLSPAESDADYLTYKCINELIPYLEDLDYSEGTLEYFKSFKDVDLLTNLKNKYELNFNDIYTNSPSYDYCNMARTKDIYKPASVLAYNQNRKETFFKDKNKYSFDERLEYGLQLTNFEFIDYYNKIYNKMNQEVEYVRKLKR